MVIRGNAPTILLRSFAAAATAGILVLSLATAGRAAPAEAKPRGPLDKVPAGSIALVGDHGLIIASPREGGGGSVAFYTAVDGGQALLNQLKAKGVVERGIPARTITEGSGTALAPPGPSDPLYTCSSGYGSAAFLGGTSGCSRGNRVNWRNNGFDDPQVYFRDHTPARWPVSASVREWNRAVGVDSFHTTGSCPTGGRHCVHVWNANYGGSVGWSGYTYIQYDSAYFMIDGQVVVHFNDYYAANSYLDRGTACHELGHALGLAHNGSLSSCMYYARTSSASNLPHSSDFDTLRYVIYP